MQQGNKTRGTAVLGGAGMVSLWGASSLIRSVQTGTLSVGNGNTSNTATITAVAVEHSVLLYGSSTPALVGSDQRNAWAKLAITNATTLTGTIITDAGYATAIQYTVVEFMPGVVKSIQNSAITLSGGGSASVSITAVNTGKSWLCQNGITTDTYTPADPGNYQIRLTFASASSVTATRGVAGAGNFVVNFQVVEFF